MAKVSPAGEGPLRPTRAEPLSPEEAEGYSRWFEHANAKDFRPSERRGGRPPLGTTYPSPRIQVRVSTEVFDALVEQAHEEGTTLSKLVRRLLEHASEAQRA